MIFGIELTAVHLTTLALTALVILYADHEALAYFRGRKQLLDKRLTLLLHCLVWLGLLGMIATGLSMALPGLSYYLSEPVFLIKMGFVIVLIINSLFITRLFPIASETPFAELPEKTKRLLLASGGVSTLSWAGAFIVGYFFL